LEDLTFDQFTEGMDLLVNFVLEEGKEYTAPVWLGEFGCGDPNQKYW
jgi:hypothetical protein